MVSAFSLWLPILLSAVFVFIASSIIHMALGYHAGDVQAVPNEEAARACIRGGECGSTRLVMLFPKDTVSFNPGWAPGGAIRMGEVMGS